jgi:integration host factor subunit beta
LSTLHARFKTGWFDALTALTLSPILVSATGLGPRGKTGGALWMGGLRPNEALNQMAMWGKDGLMGTITKKDLVERISEGTGLRRSDVKTVVQSFLDHVIEELGEGNRLEFRDFGVFETKARAARVAQNPRTLERVPVPARRTVKFKVGRLMKMAVESNGLEIDDEIEFEAELSIPK